MACLANYIVIKQRLDIYTHDCAAQYIYSRFISRKGDALESDNNISWASAYINHVGLSRTTTLRAASRSPRFSDEMMPISLRYYSELMLYLVLSNITAGL